MRVDSRDWYQEPRPRFAMQSQEGTSPPAPPRMEGGDNEGDRCEEERNRTGRRIGNKEGWRRGEELKHVQEGRRRRRRGLFGRPL